MYGSDIDVDQQSSTPLDSIRMAEMKSFRHRAEDAPSQADIWSLGITAMELAYGKTPFSDMKPLKVLKSILHGDPPKLEGEYSDDFKIGILLLSHNLAIAESRLDVTAHEMQTHC